MGEDKTKYI